METITVVTLILFVGWFLDKRARDRAEEKDRLMGKLDEILDEVTSLKEYINPEDDYTND